MRWEERNVEGVGRREEWIKRFDGVGIFEV
jgi:hypothetical protein